MRRLIPALPVLALPSLALAQDKRAHEVEAVEEAGAFTSQLHDTLEDATFLTPDEDGNVMLLQAGGVQSHGTFQTWDLEGVALAPGDTGAWVRLEATDDSQCMDVFNYRGHYSGDTDYYVVDQAQERVLSGQCPELAAPFIYPEMPEARKLTVEELGELRRLEDELERAAIKPSGVNWEEVDRAYQKLIALQPYGSYGSHARGALAARGMGDLEEAYKRALLALMVDAEETDFESLQDSALEWQTHYGEVNFKPMRPNRYAELKPEVAFIQRDRRDAVARAQAQIQETGRYEGWLPLGTYIMGDQTFTVEQPYHVVEPLPVKPVEEKRLLPELVLPEGVDYDVLSRTDIALYQETRGNYASITRSTVYEDGRVAFPNEANSQVEIYAPVRFIALDHAEKMLLLSDGKQLYLAEEVDVYEDYNGRAENMVRIKTHQTVEHMVLEVGAYNRELFEASDAIWMPSGAVNYNEGKRLERDPNHYLEPLDDGRYRIYQRCEKESYKEEDRRVENKLVVKNMVTGDSFEVVSGSAQVFEQGLVFVTNGAMPVEEKSVNERTPKENSPWTHRVSFGVMGGFLAEDWNPNYSRYTGGLLAPWGRYELDGPGALNLGVKSQVNLMAHSRFTGFQAVNLSLVYPVHLPKGVHLFPEMGVSRVWMDNSLLNDWYVRTGLTFDYYLPNESPWGVGLNVYADTMPRYFVGNAGVGIVFSRNSVL